jgi:hypothetical protein
MIPVPIGKKYTATVTGSMMKAVVCEQCRLEYVYRLTRQAQGEGTSLLGLNDGGAERRAMDAANIVLKKILDRAQDPVPCPGCGWYQEAMIAIVRRTRRGWMRRLAVVSGVVGFLAGCLAFVIFMSRPNAGWEASQSEAGLVFVWLAVLSGLLLGSAIGLPIVRYYSCRHFDPNLEDVEVHKKVGQTRAISVEEFLERRKREASRVLAENQAALETYHRGQGKRESA